MTKPGEKLLLAIPMKDPADAKTRLGSRLSPQQRASLALTLFRNGVQCLKRARAHRPERMIDIAVISSSPVIKRISSQLGLKWIDDQKADGLSAAVMRAAVAAASEGYSHLCILPGDLADPDVADILRLLDHRRDGVEAILCPAKDMGTNALLLPLPAAISFHYGERSFHHHYRALTEAGLLTAVLPLNSLREDVDTVHDWCAFKTRRPEMAAPDFVNESECR